MEAIYHGHLILKRFFSFLAEKYLHFAPKKFSSIRATLAKKNAFIYLRSQVIKGLSGGEPRISKYKELQFHSCSWNIFGSDCLIFFLKTPMEPEEMLKRTCNIIWTSICIFTSGRNFNSWPQNILQRQNFNAMSVAEFVLVTATSDLFFGANGTPMPWS